MAQKVYILSHTDLDGYFSAGLVEYFHKKYINYDATIKHKSWTYGRELPDINLITKKYDYIYVVDLCPDKEFMYKLYEYFGYEKFIWIDHHSAPDTEFFNYMKTLYPGGWKYRGRIESVEHTCSAALLCWKYFTEEFTRDDDEIRNVPYWLRLISDFDAWVKEDERTWEERVMPMFTYYKTLVHNPTEAYLHIKQRDFLGTLTDVDKDSHKLAINEYTESCIKAGVDMYRCMCSIYDSEAKHGFERTLTVSFGDSDDKKELTAWICNTQNRSSEIFKNLENIDKYDILIPYHYNGKKYFYSMYTFKEDIACNEIKIWDMLAGKPVLEFRGHRDAAGSNSENFPFLES